jgi:hypothetical protein
MGLDARASLRQTWKAAKALLRRTDTGAGRADVSYAGTVLQLL